LVVPDEKKIGATAALKLERNFMALLFRHFCRSRLDKQKANT
jgi:hypothetical protein